MKIISTYVHGVIDYATAGMLMVAPRMLGASPAATRAMAGAGLGVLGYSLMTNYELSAARVLPMRAHLALDAMNGLMMAAGPLLFRNEPTAVKAFMVLKGISELAVTMMTQPEPPKAKGFFQSTADAVDDALRRASSAAGGLRDRMSA